jgi:hypothetical protein
MREEGQRLDGRDLGEETFAFASEQHTDRARHREASPAYSAPALRSSQSSVAHSRSAIGIAAASPMSSVECRVSSVALCGPPDASHATIWGPPPRHDLGTTPATRAPNARATPAPAASPVLQAGRQTTARRPPTWPRVGRARRLTRKTRHCNTLYGVHRELPAPAFVHRTPTAADAPDAALAAAPPGATDGATPARRRRPPGSPAAAARARPAARRAPTPTAQAPSPRRTTAASQEALPVAGQRLDPVLHKAAVGPPMSLEEVLQYTRTGADHTPGGSCRAAELRMAGARSYADVMPSAAVTNWHAVCGAYVTLCHREVADVSFLPAVFRYGWMRGCGG